MRVTQLRKRFRLALQALLALGARCKMVFKDGVAYDPEELLDSVRGTLGPSGPGDHEAFKAPIVEPPGEN